MTRPRVLLLDPRLAAVERAAPDARLPVASRSPPEPVKWRCAMPVAVPRPDHDRWIDTKGAHIALFCRVEQAEEVSEPGALP